MRRAAEILQAFEQFPPADLQTILSGRRPLILAPHPDDESLGCGGIIASACEAGVTPVIVILTDGAASHPGSRTHPPRQLRHLRKTEALLAVRILGVPEENLYFLDFEDTLMPSAGVRFNQAVGHVSKIAATHNCALIIGPWAGDPHCDHEAGAAFAAALAQQSACDLISYPVWGWLRGHEDVLHEPRRAGWRLNISPYLQTKQRAIAAHQSQYADLIQDSPGGFKLPQDLLDIFARPFEVFIA